MTSVIDPTSIEAIALINNTRGCIGCDAISFAANGPSHAVVVKKDDGKEEALVSKEIQNNIPCRRRVSFLN